uniref:CHCH domain-containing protein n=1 Tax=Hippocampus comes TaxID=109280 RepID=A0A3Q2XUH7_HIPCM
MTLDTTDDCNEAEVPMEQMISHTGRAELHHALQACMGEYQDWRTCQSHVGMFKKYMGEKERRRAKFVKDRRVNLPKVRATF